MIRGILILLPMTLVACTAPITDPPAHACSPRLDGKPTYCPKLDKELLPREEVRGDLDVYDPNHWHMMQYFWMRNARREKIEQNMTQPNDAIDSALADYFEND